MLKIRVVGEKIELFRTVLVPNIRHFFDKEIIRIIELNVQVKYANFSHNQEYIACCLAQGDGILVFSTSTGEELARITLSSTKICSVSDDGDLICFINLENTACIWSLSQNRMVAQHKPIFKGTFNNIQSLYKNRFRISHTRLQDTTVLSIDGRFRSNNFDFADKHHSTTAFFNDSFCVYISGSETSFGSGIVHKNLRTSRKSHIVCRIDNPHQFRFGFGTENYVAIASTDLIMIFHLEDNIKSPLHVIPNNNPRKKRSFIKISPNEKFIMADYGVWSIETGLKVFLCPNNLNFKQLLNDFTIYDTFARNKIIYIRFSDLICVFRSDGLIFQVEYVSACDCIKHNDHIFIFHDSNCVCITPRNNVLQLSLSFLDSSVSDVILNQVDPIVFKITTNTGSRYLYNWQPDGKGEHALCTTDLSIVTMSNRLAAMDVLVNSKIVEMEAMFREQITAMKQQNDEQITTMKKQNDEQISSMKNLYDEQITSMQQKHAEEQAITNMKLNTALTTLATVVADSGASDVEKLRIYISKCCVTLSLITLPSYTAIHDLSANIAPDGMQKLADGLNECIIFYTNMKAVKRSHKFISSLSETVKQRFQAIVDQYPLAGVLSEDTFLTMQDEVSKYDEHFKFMDKCASSDLFIAFSQCLLLTDITSALAPLTESCTALLQQMEQFKEVQLAQQKKRRRKRKKLDTPVDINKLNSLESRLKRYTLRLQRVVDDRFTNAKAALGAELSSLRSQLDQLRYDVSLSVNCESLLEKLHLDNIAFPFPPTVISSALYLNGEFEHMSLDNCIIKQDDKLLKCFCVSDEYDGDYELNIKTLRKELRVLTKTSPCIVSLKNVVFVASLEENELYVDFVCLELERAPFDLFDYVARFPDISSETRNSLAHQLVQCVFFVHANGILLRDLKPQNVLVFCDDDGSNPTVKLCDFGVSVDTAQTLLGTTMVGTVGFVAPEVLSYGQPHTTMSDVFALGKTLLYLFGSNTTHSDLFNRCITLLPHYRPSIFELALHEWKTSGGGGLRDNIVRHALSKQDLSPIAYEQRSDEPLDAFFIRVFGDFTSFMDSDEFFGVRLKTDGDEMSLECFADYIQSNTLLPAFCEASALALVGFVYSCLIFGVPVDDSQIGNFLLNAISKDHSELLSEDVFSRVYPSIYASMNIEKDHSVAESFFKENANLELSARLHRAFHATNFAAAHFTGMSFHDVKNIVCREPSISAAAVCDCLKYDDAVPVDIREQLEAMLADMTGECIKKVAEWLFGDYRSVHDISVVLQPSALLGVSVGLAEHVLRVPDSARRMKVEILRISLN
ncbi:hypothetical protein PCE1_002603 [Barthelona sp. PCE]